MFEFLYLGEDVAAFSLFLPNSIFLHSTKTNTKRYLFHDSKSLRFNIQFISKVYTSLLYTCNSLAR